MDSKTEQKAETSRVPPAPAHTQPAPLSTPPSQRGTFVTICEPTVTRRDHPKSKVYTIIHAWCCTWYGFGRVYNDMCPLLYESWALVSECHAGKFHSFKTPLRSTSS